MDTTLTQLQFFLSYSRACTTRLQVNAEVKRPGTSRGSVVAGERDGGGGELASPRTTPCGWPGRTSTSAGRRRGRRVDRRPGQRAVLGDRDDGARPRSRPAGPRRPRSPRRRAAGPPGRPGSGGGKDGGQVRGSVGSAGSPRRRAEARRRRRFVGPLGAVPGRGRGPPASALSQRVQASPFHQRKVLTLPPGSANQPDPSPPGQDKRDPGLVPLPRVRSPDAGSTPLPGALRRLQPAYRDGNERARSFPARGRRG